MGADALGEEIVARLDALGLNRDYVAVEAAHPTGTVSVELDAGGRPTYIIHEKVAWDFLRPGPAMLSLAGVADAVCFGSLAQRSAVSRAAIRDFLAATDQDCLRIFDINLRQHYFDRETIAASLSWASVLKLNDEELPVVAKLLSISGGEEEMLAALGRRFDLRLIALTKGAQGALLFTPGKSSAQPGVAVEVADTVGAGDAFTAALCMGMLAGLGLDVINTHANRVARYVCGQHGATPPMPPELRSFCGGKLRTTATPSAAAARSPGDA